MSGDMNRLLNELSVTMETINPDNDTIKTKLRIEELLANYNIDRKTFGDNERDLDEKIELYLSAISLEGYSNATIKDYRYELRLFSGHVNKSIVQIATPDIRAYLSSYKGIMQSTDANIKSKLTIHRLRHSFASLALEQGISIGDLSEILGHNSSETTKIYAQVSETRKKQAHSRFHVQ